MLGMFEVLAIDSTKVL